MKNYYDLLSIDASAPPGDIKRAFRQQIARYHPDKVQHLGKEFQEIAATRAAELTEAYRVLMNAELRSEYDRQRQAPPPAPPPALEPPSSAAPSGAPQEPRTAPASDAPSQTPEPPAARQPDRRSSLFATERSSRDEFVRRASLGRLRQIAAAELGKLTEEAVRGFDVVWKAAARSALFGKGRPALRLFVRLAPQLDRASIQECWTSAIRALADDGADACVLLLGRAESIHAAGRIAADLRRRSGKGAERLCLVPIDSRDWSAQVPNDAPPSCRVIVERLKSAT